MPHLFTTLLECSASTYAHWRPFSWWRPRPPPSSPMTRNGTDLTSQTHCASVHKILLEDKKMDEVLPEVGRVLKNFTQVKVLI